jgi:phosphoribosylaminoimidazole-succinocarboxamide synthase
MKSRAKNYKKGILLYEGKAKRLYAIPGYPDLLWQEFKDDATAFDAVKRGTIVNKGRINNQLTAYIFTFLGKAGIKNHFVELISENEMIVKKVKIIKIEVVGRNIAAGSLLKKTNFKEGQVLKTPIIEFYYKEDALHDPLINDSHAVAMKLAVQKELDYLRRMAEKINSMLIPFFRKRGLKLVDFKLEFGRDKKGNILLADEISPDTCRLWDVKTNEKLDKDRFRFDLGKVEESYAEVISRVIK